jgi:hypothetical protein
LTDAFILPVIVFAVTLVLSEVIAVAAGVSGTTSTSFFPRRPLWAARSFRFLSWHLIGCLPSGGEMWAKIKAFCLNSLTIAWGYVVAFAGLLLQGLDSVADALGDPNLKDQISAAIGDTRTVGRILLGVSVLTIVARLRSLRKAS